MTFTSWLASRVRLLVGRLRRVGVEVSGSPALRMEAFPFGNLRKRGMMQTLFSTEICDPCHRVYGSIWGSNNKGFHVGAIASTHIGTDLGTLLFTKMDKTYLFNRFRRVYSPFAGITEFALGFIGMPCSSLRETETVPMLRRKLPALPRLAHLLTGFCTNRLPFQRSAQAFTDFWTHGMPKSCKAYLLSRLRRHFLAFPCLAQFLAGLSTWGFAAIMGRQSPARRMGRSCDIIALLERFFTIQPVLFSLKQEGRQDKFNDLENERRFRVLCPSSLQFLIVMLIMSKITLMFLPTDIQIATASDVAFFINEVADAVYTARGWNTRGHIPNSLVASSLVLWWLSGKQGTSFSQWFMRPVLDNQSDYTFFPRPRKAEPLEVA